LLFVRERTSRALQVQLSVAEPNVVPHAGFSPKCYVRGMSRLAIVLLWTAIGCGGPSSELDGATLGDAGVEDDAGVTDGGGDDDAGLRDAGPPTCGVVHLDTGDEHTCAVDDRSGVACWGRNLHSQLGDGTDDDRLRPVRVLDWGATRIAAGWCHSCAVDASGRVHCWGIGRDGQLGHGAASRERSPRLVPELTDVIDVDVGAGFSCAVRAGGDVMCWGSNDDGQLGDGTTVDSETPVAAVGVADAIEVSTGSYFAGSYTCALLHSGTIWCWGDNGAGMLGDSTWDARPTPGPVSGIDDAVAVSAGAHHACAVHEDGGVSCWGSNEQGALGDPSLELPSRPWPGRVAGVEDAVAIAAGVRASCAVRRGGGQVVCWGNGALGQLGDGTLVSRPSAAAVVGVEDAVGVSISEHHACAWTAAGRTWCWGYGGNGRLGDGAAVDRLVPVEVSGSPGSSGCVAP
jgi:alpha-tubulin suppressor-like RCC1 family protein